jgi:hypothetical protein
MALPGPEATYKVLSDTEIEVTSKGPDGKEKVEKSKVAVKGDELTLKEPEGKERQFKRVRAKLKDALVGKWEATEKVLDKEVKIVIEFTADKIKMKAGELELPEATYKVVGDDEIEVTSKGLDGKDKIEKARVAINSNELTLKGPDGKEMKFIRDALQDHEAVMKDTIKAFADLADALESVKDRDTAKAAAPKINDAAERLEALKKKADKLGEPKGEEGKKLLGKYQSEFEKQALRMRTAANAAQKGGGEPDFDKAIKRLADLK